MKDYYRILGVGRRATNKEIRQAYRDLAQRCHPDKNPGDQRSEERFKEINEAYETLGDASRRATYDRKDRHSLRSAGASSRRETSGFWQQSHHQRPGRSPVEDLTGAGYSSLFEEFFGDDFFGRRPSTPYPDPSSSRRRRGRDVEREVTITLEEAYHGTIRYYEHYGERLTLNIPPGSADGTRLRLPGGGEEGAYEYGDLYLNISVAPDDTFQRHGDDLETAVTVDVLMAILGGEVMVPTPEGSRSLRIPPGTQGNQRFCLAGQGMPYLEAPEQHGDLLVTVELQVPEELSAAERALYQKLLELRDQRS